MWKKFPVKTKKTFSFTKIFQVIFLGLIIFACNSVTKEGTDVKAPNLCRRRYCRLNKS